MLDKRRRCQSEFCLTGARFIRCSLAIVFRERCLVPSDLRFARNCSHDSSMRTCNRRAEPKARAARASKTCEDFRLSVAGERRPWHLAKGAEEPLDVLRRCQEELLAN